MRILSISVKNKPQPRIIKSAFIPKPDTSADEQHGPTTRERELTLLLRQNGQALEEARLALQRNSLDPPHVTSSKAEVDDLHREMDKLRGLLADGQEKRNAAESKEASAIKHQSILAKNVNDAESNGREPEKQLAEEVKRRSTAEQRLAEVSRLILSIKSPY